jgi:signal transduction histidine kinase
MRYGRSDMGLEVAAETVLVVDDNGANRALAHETLDDEGLRVVLAASGEEAITAFEREQPDCILLDIRMAGMDGITVCEQIRRLPNGAAVAIVFVTAQRDVETFDRAVLAGGDDFLTKPFRPQELIVRVRTALRLRKIAAEHGELSMQLKQQRDELQRLQLHKEQLSAFLVHDLKNPVNAIELQAQRVLRNPGADERSRDAAMKIHDESRALLRMITNLLDIGRADEGQLAPVRRPIDPSMLVASAIEELQASAAAAGVRLVAVVHASLIDADLDLMHRVLANLLENAIRHAPEGSDVRVLVERGDRCVIFQVSDIGAGVPEALRARVFERFVSGREAGRTTNRGLGLAFCKLAVEAQGGRIWVEDGQPGARFVIKIPDVD